MTNRGFYELELILMYIIDQTEQTALRNIFRCERSFRLYCLHTRVYCVNTHRVWLTYNSLKWFVHFTENCFQRGSFCIVCIHFSTSINPIQWRLCRRYAIHVCRCAIGIALQAFHTTLSWWHSSNSKRCYIDFVYSFYSHGSPTVRMPLVVLKHGPQREGYGWNSEVSRMWLF